ncbi:MAG: PAS domain-containing protein, partial [Promethearchaeota archaeon]
MPPSKHHTSSGSVSGLTESMAAQQFAVVSEMPYVVVVSVNRRGRITFFSRGAERITGYTHDELARKSFVAHLIPPEQHQLVRGHIQEVVTGTSVEFVSHLLTKTGKMQTIKWTGSPRTDAEGTVRGVLIVGVDVTELADLDSLLT